jgi:tetratricopeptide (TPR) repeat protein
MQEKGNSEKLWFDRRFDPATLSRRRLHNIIFGLVCVLVVGMFAWSAESGFFEWSYPPGDSYYNLLVQGFRAGQLNVKREAPPRLAELADPYDPAANSSIIADADKEHKCFDMSYYRGKLYLYFGITPALVLFWPYAALTGHYLLHKDAVVLFYSLGFLVFAGLFRAVWRRYFQNVNFWIVAAGMLTLGLATGTLEVLSRCDVYEVPMSCGYAFTMLSVAALWCALHEPGRRVLWVLLASFAYGLAVGSRPSLLFGIVVLLTPMVQTLRERRGPRALLPITLLLGAAAGPVTVIGLGLMAYNFLRFGNPLEFGWHYQLTAGYQPDKACLISLHYLLHNLRFYSLEPMRWSGHFPFLEAGNLALPSGFLGGDGTFYSGILSNIPLVWLAVVTPLAWRGRSDVPSALRCFVVALSLLFAACALTVCLIGFVSSRYQMDFVPILMLLAVMGILALEQTSASFPVRRYIARTGWCLLMAYSLLFNILASVEAHATTHFLLGNSLWRSGRLDESILQYEKATELQPDMPISSYVGRLLLEQKRPDDALPWLQRALAMQPDNAQVHRDLGNVLLQKGRVDLAIAHCRRAIELEPNDPQALNNYGLALLGQGDLTNALSQFSKAVSLRPDDAGIRFNLGDALFQSGQTAAAVAQFEKAVEIQPAFADAHYHLAVALSRVGRVGQSVSHLQQTISLRPDFADAHNSMGTLYLQAGRWAEAVAQYQTAVNLQPANAFALNNLAWVLATCPDGPIRNGLKAVELGREAQRLSKGEDAPVLETLAAAYAEAGRFPEAIETVRRALASARAGGNQGLAKALEDQLSLYQAGKPFHEAGK